MFRNKTYEVLLEMPFEGMCEDVESFETPL